MSYPFILSEHYPFRPPQKTGGNDPEKRNWTHDSPSTHYNKKGTITTDQPLRFPCHGHEHFNNSSNTMKPRPRFFQYLNSLASYPTHSLATAVGPGHAEHWFALCLCGPTFHQRVLLGSKWFSSLSSLEVSFSPSVSRSWLYERLVYSVKFYCLLFSYFFKTFNQTLSRKDSSVAPLIRSL